LVGVELVDDVNELLQHPHREGAGAAGGVENLAGVDGVEQSSDFGFGELVGFVGVGEELVEAIGEWGRHSCLPVLNGERSRQECLLHTGFFEPKLVRLEIRLDGVFYNVAEEVTILRLATDDVVEGFVEPEGAACGAEEFVGFACAGAFNPLKELREVMPFERFDQRMNMVGHNDGGMNAESLAIEF